MLLAHQDNANGTSTTLNYDANRRTTQVRHATAAGVEIQRAFYEYDGVGRPLFRASGAGIALGQA